MGVTKMASVNALFISQHGSSFGPKLHSLSDKVADLSHNHCQHPRPPHPALQIPMALSCFIAILFRGFY